VRQEHVGLIGPFVVAVALQRRRVALGSDVIIDAERTCVVQIALAKRASELVVVGAHDLISLLLLLLLLQLWWSLLAVSATTLMLLLLLRILLLLLLVAVRVAALRVELLRRRHRVHSHVCHLLLGLLLLLQLLLLLLLGVTSTSPSIAHGHLLLLLLQRLALLLGTAIGRWELVGERRDPGELVLLHRRWRVHRILVIIHNITVVGGDVFRVGERQTRAAHELVRLHAQERTALVGGRRPAAADEVARSVEVRPGRFLFLRRSCRLE